MKEEVNNTKEEIETKETVKRSKKGSSGIWKNVVTIVGVLIGILGVCYAYYVENIKDKNAKIAFEIISNSNVFSVNESVNKLSINYDGIDIISADQILKLINIRIRNNGEQNITKEFYDPRDPFGFKITGGRIIEKPEFLDASNDYLKNNLELTQDSLNINNIYFNDILIDKSQYFDIKVLTICHKDSVPDIKPFGKISGIVNEFPVIKKTTEELDERRSELQYLLLVISLVVMTIVLFFTYIQIKRNRHYNEVAEKIMKLTEDIRIKSAEFDLKEKQMEKFAKSINHMYKMDIFKESDSNDKEKTD